MFLWTLTFILMIHVTLVMHSNAWLFFFAYTDDHSDDSDNTGDALKCVTAFYRIHAFSSCLCTRDVTVRRQIQITLAMLTHPPNWSKMPASNEQCSWVETKVITGLCQCLCQPIPSEYMKSHLCTLTYVAHSSLCNVWPQIGQWDWVTCPVKSGAAILHDATTHVMFGVLRVPLILSQLLID